MQVRIDQADPHIQKDSLLIDSRDGYKSAGAFVRHWCPYILTALVVPGGIVVALLLLLRHWHQKRLVA